MLAVRRGLACLIAALLLVGCGQPEPASPAVPTVPAAAKAAPTSTLTPPAAVPTATAELGSEDLSADEVKTLSSLEQVDGYPLYTMHYYGAYRPRQGYVEAGGSGTSKAWACSLFAALGDPGNSHYGRNFDWEFSPALLLFTDPADGYASLSMVDIAYLGFGQETAKGVASLPLAGRESLLLAPWLPFDGMNEAGLAVGMAAVPPGNVPADPAKPTLSSLGLIREMLDHAGTVEEAIAIVEAHNIDFAGGPDLHYLVADRSGSAALVEYYAGQVHVFPNDKPWHQATNFLLAEAGEAVAGQCSRYDAISQALSQAQGKMTAVEAMALLSTVAQPHTQWSVVYGLSNLQVQVAMGQQYDDSHTFNLSPGATVP
jgi:hypothetical protein